MAFFALILLVIVAGTVYSLEPVVTIRHPGGLPELELDLDRLYFKKTITPTVGETAQYQLGFQELKMKESTIPGSIDFEPTANNRYQIIKGNVSVSFGEIYLGTKNKVYFRDTVSESGKFSLGPIRRGRFTRLYLYYLLEHRNVKVVYNNGSNVKPVKVRIGTINFNKLDQNSRSYSINPSLSWKRKAFSYFEKFVNALEDGPKFKDKQYRIEYMKGLDRHKVRRKGTHYLFPLRD